MMAKVMMIVGMPTTFVFLTIASIEASQGISCWVSGSLAVFAAAAFFTGWVKSGKSRV